MVRDRVAAAQAARRRTGRTRRDAAEPPEFTDGGYAADDDAEITGPGPMFDSALVAAAWQGSRLLQYTAKEYFVSGTANGQPYKTRMVVRMPADRARFSGLVLAESMHGSGAAHMFEFTSIYTMSSGHAAVEVVTTANTPGELTKLNEARYKDMAVVGGQANDILAQAGALIKSGSPLGGAGPRKMVLAGTSQTAGTLINYLPAHVVYRTPKMERIYDGFMPTSNGATITRRRRSDDAPADDARGGSARISPWRQDSDEPGKQYRIYEFSGMAHIDTRDSVRMKPNPCAQPLSDLPLQAYMSVGLHHLLQWVDKGIVAAARRTDLARSQTSTTTARAMALDETGNPRGGIRSPYVDVPAAKYRDPSGPREPADANAERVDRRRTAARGQQMCSLSALPDGASTGRAEEAVQEQEELREHGRAAPRRSSRRPAGRCPCIAS